MELVRELIEMKTRKKSSRKRLQVITDYETDAILKPSNELKSKVAGKIIMKWIATRAVESEVPSSDSDSDSGQFRLSDSDSNSDSDSGPTPTFSCISYLK